MTKKLKCIIIDDEPIARQYLSDYVDKMPQLKLIGTFEKAEQAYELIETDAVDLLFLDIQMPGISGIEFIRTLDKKPEIILTTAFSEYALEGYELDVSDYLLKPIAFERFAKAVTKISARQAREIKQQSSDIGESKQFSHDFIFLKSGYKSIKIDVGDICYIEGMKEYIVIYTEKRKFIQLDRMKNMELQLQDHGFVRIHKSFIVSLKHIQAVYGNVVEVSGKQLPVGRSYKDKVNQLLDTHL